MANVERATNLADRFIVSAIGSYFFDQELDDVSADVRWEEFLHRADRHGVSPLLYFITSDDLRFTMPELVAERLKDSFLSSFVRHAAYEDLIGKLAAYLAERGTEVIVLKGLVLSQLLYPDPALRPFVDVDLLIKEKDWSIIREFLINAGFSPTRDIGEVLPPKLIAGEVFEHNLGFYNPDSGLKVELKLDLFDLGIGSKMIHEVWDSSVVYDFGSFECRSLSPEHQLIQLLLHLNEHGFRRLKWFTDIALILKNGPALDWDMITSLAKREQVAALVYFSLIYVCRLFAIELSEEILRPLKPGYVKSKVWTSVWPEEDIKAFRGVEYGALYFRHEVFSKWFIPNVLLTGRAMSKSSYFLRRVFPPRDFLEQKYSDGAKRSYAYYIAKRYRGLLTSSSKEKARYSCENDDGQHF